jgi:hypothetical protein
MSDKIVSYLNDAKCSGERWNRIFYKHKPLKVEEENKDIPLDSNENEVDQLLKSIEETYKYLDDLRKK